jgi:hypothetical protein
MLSAKCIQLCIAHHRTVDRSKEALKAALSFAKANNNPGSHKIPRALHAFKTFAASNPEIVGEHKEALDALYAEFSIDKALEKAKFDMVYANEMLKHDVKNSDLVLKALKDGK